jgi:hypothetical protein
MSQTSAEQGTYGWYQTLSEQQLYDLWYKGADVLAKISSGRRSNHALRNKQGEQ